MHAGVWRRGWVLGGLWAGTAFGATPATDPGSGVDAAGSELAGECPDRAGLDDPLPGTCLVGGARIADPVTGTFSAAFDPDPGDRAVLPGRVVAPVLYPPRNILGGVAGVSGGVGAGVEGRLHARVEGPLVRDRAAFGADVFGADRTGLPAPRGVERDVSDSGVGVRVALRTRSLHLATDAALRRTTVDSEIDAPFARSTASAGFGYGTYGVHRSLFLHGRHTDTRTRLDESHERVRHSAVEAVGILAVDTSLELSSSLKLDVLSGERVGSVVGLATPVDRFAVRGPVPSGPFSETRSTLVLEQAWAPAAPIELRASGEVQVTSLGKEASGFLGGRAAARVEPLSRVTLEATARRETLAVQPTLASRRDARPVVVHAVQAHVEAEVLEDLFLFGSAGYDQLGLAGLVSPMRQLALEVGLRRPLLRRWSAAVTHRTTELSGSGSERAVVRGVSGLAFAPPPRLVSAQAEWSLPFDPVGITLSAGMDADLAGWTDLAVGYRQRFDVRRGRVELAVDGTNLLDSRVDGVGEVLDDRFALTGPQRGRRVEVGLVYYL